MLLSAQPLAARSLPLPAACQVLSELATEAAVHAHASKQLDETLAEFRQVFDVDALIRTFESSLDHMMARGTWRNNSATGMGTGLRHHWHRRPSETSSRRREGRSESTTTEAPSLLVLDLRL